jgi:hypothetical protein
MWLHSLGRWTRACSRSEVTSVMCNCSISFLLSPTPKLSFSHYKHNCTLKVEAENSSETLETLNQNTPSHSAADYLTYNIKRQLERSARQWCTSFTLRHDVTSLRSDLSVTRTRTHCVSLVKVVFATQQSWENRQSSAAAAALVIAHPQFTVFIKLRKYERIHFDLSEIFTKLWAWRTERVGRNVLSRNTRMFQTPLLVA